MAGTYSELKQLINQDINTNGNQEITGKVLNSVLTQIVTEFGAHATFVGFADPNTHPGTYDENVFFIATVPGQYTNFGNKTLPKGKIAAFINSSGTWQMILASVVGAMTTDGGEVFNDYTDNNANGQYAHAEGFKTNAEGNSAHSEGYQTSAFGHSSHSEGRETNAGGTRAHAEGYKTVASGSNSHAEGNSCRATGNNAHAEGYQTSAEASSSHSEGYNAHATAENSHAEGSSTFARAPASHAEGNACIAEGNNAHAEGSNSKASGNSSHAEGLSSEATGLYSHAEGIYCEASGTTSHAEGNACIAANNGAHAEGYRNNASGEFSHVGGALSEANGRYAFCHGYHATAPNYGQFSIGVYNEIGGTPNALYYDATKRAFSIGNDPTGGSRSDAFRVLGNGNVYAAGSITPSGADYAEMFEWLDGNPDEEDRVGYIVALSGDKIVKATGAEDFIIGVVSGTYTIIGDASIYWHSKYLNDEWGRPVYETVEYTEKQEQDVLDSEGNPTCDSEGNRITQEVEVVRQAKVQKLNPDYDPEAEYVPREQRPEWAAIGLLGKVLVRQDGTLSVGSFCKPNSDGIATDAETGYYVLEIINENQARVLVK